ncbi:MAG TPA: peptidylprolyl isomerase [Bacillota bacterium]|nr:peptidylprolyl isomerase [Bacillota bacterium]
MKMLKNWKKRVTTAIIIILAMVVAGCGMIGVNDEKDRKQVVAQVNGKEILKGEVIDEFDLYSAVYGVQEDQEKEIKLQILDQLVNRAIIIQKAKEAGFELNDDYRQKAEEDKDAFVQQDADQQKAEDENENDGPTMTDEEYLEQARTDFENWLEGIGMSEKQYVDRIADDMLLQDYFKDLTGDVTVEDEELEKLYDAELEFQVNYPSYSEYSSVEIVSEPAMRRVKHILIKLDDEITEEIEELRVAEKEDEADELREDKLKEIKSRADEVLAKVKGGDDFEELLKEYGEDPGMKDDKFADGYTMLRDESMRQEFLETSFELGQDETSDLVATDNGYHIIRVLEAKEDEVIDFEQVKDDIHEVLLEDKRNKETNTYMEEWVNNSDIEIFENLL